MSEKLQQGDRFPALNLRLVGGGELSLPSASGQGGESSRYTALLFYRGHW